MIRWRTVVLVAGREVRQRLRSRAFLVVTGLFAVLIAIGAAVPAVVGDRFAAVDELGGDAPTIGIIGQVDEATIAALTATFGAPPDRVRVPDEAAAATMLEHGSLAFVLADGGTRILAAGSAGPFGSPVPAGVPEALGAARALNASGLAPDQVTDVLGAPPVEVEVVITGTGVDPQTAAGRFAVAYAGAVLLYFVLIFFANLIVTGVIEEKSSRVVELLLPAVPARQLMGGKVLGLGTLGTLQAATMITPGLVILTTLGRDNIPPRLGVSAASVLVAFVLGYGLYAGVTAGLSALVSRVEDSQVALFPLYALLIGAFATTFPVLGSPDSTLAQVATFVPFTAPFVVPARIALVDLPLWQAAISGVLVIVTAVLLTLLAARLYEGSILRAGARVSLRSAWRGARE
ncbi:ABC transporter permease [Nitriliruptor alkaliphilus]|uniref:ABC transporter permease n=1 Tax=Nitriliruptor alkaliphilus TaxID=427918 RepID=UPI000696DDC9|nr:ABC transporter permease [Nitriliruptor alkaliphilus]